jgi:Ran GTPase-activating protein (RanGAP) involved in mRNA processing and transport
MRSSCAQHAATLDNMRSLLSTRVLKRTRVHGRASEDGPHPDNPLVRDDVLSKITEQTPDHNRMLMATSKSIRDAMKEKTPAHFRSTDFPDQPETILTLLEKRSKENSLLSIEMPGLIMDSRLVSRSPRLAAVMSHCPRLQTLNLSNASIREWGVIGDALAHCPGLQHLDVSNCKIRHHAEHFARWIQAGTSLTKLNLSDNALNSSVAPNALHWLTDALAQCKNLQHLDLSDNNFGAPAAALLAPALKQCHSLKHLDLSKNDFGPLSAPDLAAALSECRTLEHINLSRNHFENTSAEILAPALIQCHGLAHLDLCRNEFGMESASQFSWVINFGNLPLTHFDLSDNRIGKHGFNHLALNHIGHGLTYLNLAHNHIQLLQHEDVRLPEMDSLVHLKLNGNRLDNKYVQLLLLELELPKCRALTFLDLRTTGLTDAGVLTLPRSIKAHQTMTRL